MFRWSKFLRLQEANLYGTSAAYSDENAPRPAKAAASRGAVTSEAPGTAPSLAMESKPTRPATATSGTSPAINYPPRLITLPKDQEGVIKGPIKPDEGAASGDPDRDRVLLGLPEYTWQTCSRHARMVVEHMRRCTPPGARPPWRSSPSVTPIQRMLDEGVPVEDLIELVEGAALLVASGRQAPKWYYPGNLFGPRNVERWLADVAELTAEREKADARQRELEAIEARSRKELEEAREPTGHVADLRLRAIAAKLMRTVSKPQLSVVACEDAVADQTAS